MPAFGLKRYSPVHKTTGKIVKAATTIKRLRTYARARHFVWHHQNDVSFWDGYYRGKNGESYLITVLEPEEMGFIRPGD